MSNYETVTQDDIRAIHSRLDVHKQVMERIAESVYAISLDSELINDIDDMLEESQNPFEVSDD